jgi:hypothetical protein
VQAHELQLLLAGGPWEKVHAAKMWRPLDAQKVKKAIDRGAQA